VSGGRRAARGGTWRRPRTRAGGAGGPAPGGDMEITKRDRSRMNNKIIQLFRFAILNLKILKGVNHAKRS